MRERGVTGKDISPSSVSATGGTSDFTDVQIEAEIPQDVSGSRSDNTWETNTTGYPLMVYVRKSSGGAAADWARSVVHINTSQSDNEVHRVEVQNADSANTKNTDAGVSFMVPPGANYKVNTAPGGPDNWFESRIGVA